MPKIKIKSENSKVSIKLTFDKKKEYAAFEKLMGSGSQQLKELAEDTFDTNIKKKHLEFVDSLYLAMPADLDGDVANEFLIDNYEQ